MIKKAIIPAAGLGTRFLPVTKSMPKEMSPSRNCQHPDNVDTLQSWISCGYPFFSTALVIFMVFGWMQQKQKIRR